MEHKDPCTELEASMQDKALGQGQEGEKLSVSSGARSDPQGWSWGSPSPARVTGQGAAGA